MNALDWFLWSYGLLCTLSAFAVGGVVLGRAGGRFIRGRLLGYAGARPHRCYSCHSTTIQGQCVTCGRLFCPDCGEYRGTGGWCSQCDDCAKRAKEADLGGLVAGQENQSHG